MTRKQALMRVCEILDTCGQTREIREIRDKVGEVIGELPLTAWSEAAIFDAIDQWILENGRIPNTGDLTRKGLPPIPVIKNRFKMRARAFLDRYYPGAAPKCPSARYGDRTKAEWVADFVSQYMAILPRSAAEYNRKRAEGSPTWATVAAICALRKWSDLLTYCELDMPQRAVHTGRKTAQGSYSVQRRTDVEEAYARIDRAEPDGPQPQTRRAPVSAR